MVVFEKGVPNKKLYRRFNIKTVTGADDFASMEEVLARRFKRWSAAQEKQQEEVGAKADPAFAILPDLLMVDGGKGQLGRALKVLEEDGLAGQFLTVGLAKEQELLHLPGNDRPLALPRRSQGLFLLQRVRDEAHRFAITAHRGRRTRENLVSRLDQIPGVGPTRRMALLTRFGSLEGVRKASPADITGTAGISAGLAQQISEFLNRAG
jgi:excinuclease ABC subunit C